MFIPAPTVITNSLLIFILFYLENLILPFLILIIVYHYTLRSSSILTKNFKLFSF
nr:MAG TPA: hypothetical protein [Caudoviricetes sp.]DAX98648.1 MAG TPA: hypothetical protein [Caudoviricetes sp.]